MTYLCLFLWWDMRSFPLGTFPQEVLDPDIDNLDSRIGKDNESLTHMEDFKEVRIGHSSY